MEHVDPKDGLIALCLCKSKRKRCAERCRGGGGAHTVSVLLSLLTGGEKDEKKVEAMSGRVSYMYLLPTLVHALGSLSISVSSRCRGKHWNRSCSGLKAVGGGRNSVGALSCRKLGWMRLMIARLGIVAGEMLLSVLGGQ